MHCFGQIFLTSQYLNYKFIFKRDTICLTGINSIFIHAILDLQVSIGKTATKLQVFKITLNLKHLQEVSDKTVLQLYWKYDWHAYVCHVKYSLSAEMCSSLRLAKILGWFFYCYHLEKKPLVVDNVIFITFFFLTWLIYSVYVTLDFFFS